MEKICKLYNEVFDEDGNIKLCGRDKCKELISACQEYYSKIRDIDTDFGNLETGFMNVENIKKLVQIEA